jgi:hypothetical protein
MYKIEICDYHHKNNAKNLTCDLCGKDCKTHFIIKKYIEDGYTELAVVCDESSCGNLWILQETIK